MQGTFENRLNVQLFYDTLARILGEKYGAEITVTVRPKEEVSHNVGEIEENPPLAV